MDGKLILGFLNYLFLGLIFVFGLAALAVRDQRRKLTFLFLALLSAGVLSYLFFAGIAFLLPAIILIFFYLLLYMFITSQEFYGFGRPSPLAGRNLVQGMKGAHDTRGAQSSNAVHDSNNAAHDAINAAQSLITAQDANNSDQSLKTAYGRKGAHAANKEAQEGKGFRIKPSLIINFLFSLAVCAGAGTVFFNYNKDFLKGLQLVESFKVAVTQDIINDIGANYIPAILLICVALFSSVFWFISILENRRTKI